MLRRIARDAFALAVFMAVFTLFAIAAAPSPVWP